MRRLFFLMMLPSAFVHSFTRPSRKSSLTRCFSSSRSHELLASSRLGLDPAKNHIHAPFVYHENYSFADWPENHTFPMNKFAQIAHALTNNTLVQEETHFFRPLDFHEMIATGWLSGPIDSNFVQRFIQGQLTKEECRRIGFREQTSRPELIERTVLEVAGTILTCQLACQWGLAANLAGGTHHAAMTHGAGYTILNDLAVATHVLPKQRVLVVDCDVHQGDGTAQFGNENGPLHGKLITLSLHCESNYPQPKAHSNIDVGLPDGLRDDGYMRALEDAINKAIQLYDPDFCIYNAGVDIYENDVLGRLKVSEAGIRRRDRYVLDRFVSAGIPIAATVGGGYDKDVDALARRHAIVHEEAAFVWRKHKMWERGAR